jgi:hypothetical protein
VNYIPPKKGKRQSKNDFESGFEQTNQEIAEQLLKLSMSLIIVRRESGSEGEGY